MMCNAYLGGCRLSTDVLTCHLVLSRVIIYSSAASGENSPVKGETDCAAIYANHSARWPNARVETWPVVPNPGPYELRHHMMIVAIEPIDAGAESTRSPIGRHAALLGKHAANATDIGFWDTLLAEALRRALGCRLAVPGVPLTTSPPHHVTLPRPVCRAPWRLAVRINYEDGNELYWQGEPPSDSGGWRQVRLRVPPPAAMQPVINRLVELQTASVLRCDPPPCSVPYPLAEPAPWEGVNGWDGRLQAVVAFLSPHYLHGVGSSVLWSMVSTHLPGRSGAECRERWMHLNEGAMMAAVPLGHRCVSCGESSTTSAPLSEAQRREVFERALELRSLGRAVQEALHGWKLEVRLRRRKDLQGQKDLYATSPNGTTYRSGPQLAAVLKIDGVRWCGP